MSTPRSSQLRAQIEGELHRLQVGPRFPPDLTVYVQLLRDVLTLLDAEPEQPCSDRLRPTSQSGVETVARKVLEVLTQRASDILNETCDRYRVGRADGILEAVEAVERARDAEPKHLPCLRTHVPCSANIGTFCANCQKRFLDAEPEQGWQELPQPPNSWVLPVRYDGTDVLDATNRLIVWDGDVGDRTCRYFVALVNATTPPRPSSPVAEEK